MSAIGGVILLSSSPQRVFARSPTPAENASSSPALPSPASIFASQRSQGLRNAGAPQPANLSLVARHPKSSTTSIIGDGHFGSSKKLLLQEKPSKVNVPIVRKVECRKLQEVAEPQKQKAPRSLSPTRSRWFEHGSCIDNQITSQLASISVQHACREQSETTAVPRSQGLRPLHLDRPSSPQLDRTEGIPAEPCIGQASPESAAVSFTQSSLDSFGYNPASHELEGILFLKAGRDGNPTKRRRIDVVNHGALAPACMAPHKRHVRVSKSPNERVRNMGKKKHTTITGLATSHYSGEGTSGASPMLQYLSSTQHQATDHDSASTLDLPKGKRAVKKSKNAKVALNKSTLRSPQSAIKAFEGQDMLFGSASQLARDESPTSVRNTVQAIKYSEDTSLIPDPICTQMTVPTSEPAETPKRHDRRGVSRFVKTRNLWSAAGRDDDNALLQVDTVDLFDSPDIRAAFAGKDVLLEPGAPRFRDSVSPEKQVLCKHNPIKRLSSSIRWLSPGLADLPESHHSEGTVEVDELELETPYAVRTSKPLSQIQTLHHMAAANVNEDGAHQASKDLPTMPAQHAPSAGPTRPSFAGFTTSQLASQLAAYGFKPIKKREKMIETLDKCWNDKHNVNPDPTSVTNASRNESSKTSHADILTTVHDISARPIPKVSKTKGSVKKDAASIAPKSTAKKAVSKQSVREVVTVEKATSVRKTKKASKAVQLRTEEQKDVASTSSETSRAKSAVKGRAKRQTAALVEAHIVDIDDIEENDCSVVNAMQHHPKNTLVQPADNGDPWSLPALPPSCDAFDRASLLEDESIAASTLKPAVTKAKRPTDEHTSKNSDHESANSTSTSPSPSLSAGMTTPAPTRILPMITSPSSSSSCTNPCLSSQITLAVTTFQCPSSQSTTHHRQLFPTFYQKILMYDPIVLEDLAAWLNTEGFKAIGEDREVGPLEVRDWCEERGVCCFWRSGGWGGRVRG